MHPARARALVLQARCYMLTTHRFSTIKSYDLLLAAPQSSAHHGCSQVTWWLRASKIILPDFICVIHLIDNVTANATRYTNMIYRCATAYSYCAAVLALIKVLVIIGISFGLRCGSALAYVSVIFVSRTRCCGAYRSKAYSYDINYYTSRPRYR